MTQTETRERGATSRDERFIESLERLVEREDRAALAELRRGLGRPPGGTVGMYRYVVPFLPPDAKPWAEEPYYLVASLFALHQRGWSKGERKGDTSLGASFARLGGEASDSTEKRFAALLNAEADELPYHLRQAVGLLAAHDVPVDWLRLLRDIRRWGHPDRYVQRSWARAYWRGPSEEDGGTTENRNTES